MRATPLVQRWTAAAALALLAAVGTNGTHAQGPGRRGASAQGDWPLHNLDLATPAIRRSTEINTSNAGTLALKWSFDSGQGARTADAARRRRRDVLQLRLAAVRAGCGDRQGSSGRSRPSRRFAAAAAARRTATAASTRTAARRLRRRREDRQARRVVRRQGRAADRQQGARVQVPGQVPGGSSIRSRSATSMTTPPTYFNGTLYVGMSVLATACMPGGLRRRGGRHDRRDQVGLQHRPAGAAGRWAGRSRRTRWSSGARVRRRHLDAAGDRSRARAVYVNAANPSPDYDGSARAGHESLHELDARAATSTPASWRGTSRPSITTSGTGISSPARCCSTSTVNGRTVKAIGSLGKTCYAYFWNRETGKPLNPIVETAVPTHTDVPGEQVWPTQPIPYTSTRHAAAAVLRDVSDRDRSGAGEARAAQLSTRTR